MKNALTSGFSPLKHLLNRCLCLSLCFTCLMVLGDQLQQYTFEQEQPLQPPKHWGTVLFMDKDQKAAHPATATVIAQAYGNLKQAVRLDGAEHSGLDLHLRTKLPVTCGEVIRLDIVYKAKPGTLARCGYYGYSDTKFVDYNAKNFRVNSSDWEKQTVTFPIREKAIATFSPFLNVSKKESIIYASLSVSKINPSQNLPTQSDTNRQAGLLQKSLAQHTTDAYEANFLQTSDGKLPTAWKLETQDGGHVHIIRDPFNEGALRPLAAKLAGGKTRSAELIHQHRLPVQQGDVLVFEFTFKTKKGQFACVGFKGYDRDNRPTALDGKQFKAIENGWDRRIMTFSVTDPKTCSLAPFVSSHPQTDVVYSYVKITKTSPQEALIFSPISAQKNFQRQCQGKNLALNRPITFRPEPFYPLTSEGGTDKTDLTDGKLAQSNQLWFEKEAVHFHHMPNGCSITVDLGQVRKVGKAVIRIQGGNLKRQAFPQTLELWVSKDGKNSYRTQVLDKVNVNEDYMSNWKDLYYLPEANGDNTVPPYVYPFTLNANAEARYVTFRFPAQLDDNTLTTDELAVLEATPEQAQDAAFNSVYQNTPKQLDHGALVVAPGMDTFYITEGDYLPNYLRLDNQLKENTGHITYAIDLPAGVTYKPSQSWTRDFCKLESHQTANGRQRWTFRPQGDVKRFLFLIRFGFGPFFFSIKNAQDIPQNQRFARFLTWHNQKLIADLKRPLKVLTIPKVNLSRLDNSIWMEDFARNYTPDYDTLWKTIGFTTDMYHPRSLKVAKEILPLILRSKAQGKKIRLEIEPTHWYWQHHGNNPEYRCVGSEKDIYSVCLAYRGKLYQEGVDRVRDILRLLPADMVSFDIEICVPPRMNATIRKCTRCQELKKQQGLKSWVDFFEYNQARLFKDYVKAAEEGARLAGRKPPKIGFYSLSPISFYNCLEGPVAMQGYKYLFPKYSDEVQVSAYDESTTILHNKMRRVFRVIRNPRITIPWISAGSGAFMGNPRKCRTEQHVVETLMNGAGGMQFFKATSFESPLDYVYMARGFAMLAPYEDIIMDGSLEEQITASEPTLLCTARKLGNRILFLAGNYERRNQTTATINLKNIHKVKTLSDNASATLKDGTVTINVGPDACGLFLLEL